MINKPGKSEVRSEHHDFCLAHKPALVSSVSGMAPTGSLLHSGFSLDTFRGETRSYLPHGHCIWSSSHPCITADNLVSSTGDAISTTDSLSTGENADGSPSSSRQPRSPTLADSPCYAVDRLGTLTVVSPASDGRQRVVGQKRVFACRPTLALEPLEHGGGLVGP